jgi:hypothetical protein
MTLLEDVNKAIAKRVNKLNSSRKFDLGYRTDDDVLLKLINYKKMLEVPCYDCLNSFTEEEITSAIKSTINKI